MVVSYVAIDNQDGSIQLSDLCDYKGDPSLNFKNCPDGFWDSRKYLKKMFKQLRKGDRHKGLYKFCMLNNLNYTETVVDLLEIYEESKKLKMWKKKKKKTI